MAVISAQQVKALRDQTGCGMMECKKALVETDGDMEKAVVILREKGLATAAKKASRIAAEGYIGVYNDGKVAAIVEVNCEPTLLPRTPILLRSPMISPLWLQAPIPLISTPSTLPFLRTARPLKKFAPALLPSSARI